MVFFASQAGQSEAARTSPPSMAWRCRRRTDGASASVSSVSTSRQAALSGSLPQGLPPESYAGHYDNDGQMTWQFAAYPVEEIRRAMADASAQPEAEETEEAVAYQSPVRHRRGRRK